MPAVISVSHCLWLPTYCDDEHSATVTEMVAEEIEVADDEAEAPVVKTEPAAAKAAPAMAPVIKAPAKQSSIMGFFTKKPSA